MLYIEIDKESQALLHKISSKREEQKEGFVISIRTRTFVDILSISCLDIVIRDLMDKSIISADKIQELNIEYDHKINGFHPSVYHATVLRVRR